MALVRVTLTAAITSSQLTFGVSSTSSQAFPAVGAPPVGYQPFMIDDEMSFLVSCPAVNIVTVRCRGADGTEAVAHDVGSTVVTSASPIDFPAIQPGGLVLKNVWAPDIVTYGQDGVITPPIEGFTVAFLAKATAGAYTLGAPSLALNGIILQLTSQTAAAHTVTTPGASGSTGLFFTAASGSPFTIATFGTQIGSSVQLVAQNGAWNVINSSITAVTFT